MTDPKHPRHFSEEFKRQIVELHNAGKPVSEIMSEYDLGRSTVRRWITRINETGSSKAADNRTPEQQRLLELEKGNKRLRMEVDVLKTGSAEIRTKVTVIAANAGRYPISAQCEILGVPRSTYYAMRGKDARLVESAFATLDFPLGDIEAFHTDRGSEFDNAAIDELLGAFGIKLSLSKKVCPYDNAVDELTNKILKAEFVYRERFSTLCELQVKLSDCVHWYNNFRLHSTLGYMSPIEFRLAGLTL